MDMQFEATKEAFKALAEQFGIEVPQSEYDELPDRFDVYDVIDDFSSVEKFINDVTGETYEASYEAGKKIEDACKAAGIRYVVIYGAEEFSSAETGLFPPKLTNYSYQIDDFQEWLKELLGKYGAEDVAEELYNELMEGEYSDPPNTSEPEDVYDALLQSCKAMEIAWELDSDLTYFTGEEA